MFFFKGSQGFFFFFHVSPAAAAAGHSAVLLFLKSKILFAQFAHRWRRKRHSLFDRSAHCALDLKEEEEEEEETMGRACVNSFYSCAEVIPRQPAAHH